MTDERRATLREWGLSLGAVAACSALLMLFRASLVLLDVALVYLLGIVLLAGRVGRRPTLAATVLSVACFDFLFEPPAFFFSFLEPRVLFTDAVMFVVAHLTSSLTLRIREQAAAAQQRERQTAILYSLSRELAANAGVATLSKVALRHVEDVVPGRASLILAGEGGELDADAGREGAADAAAVAAALDRGVATGRGTAVHGDAAALYLPLRTAIKGIGVLRVVHPPAEPTSPAQTSLLESLARQIAVALERAMLVEEAKRAAMRAERESMRSTLLSSISHDLRTPLAAIVGAATALRQEGVALTQTDRDELLETIAAEGERLDRIVRNILALTRVESSMTPLRAEPQSLEELFGAVLDRLDQGLLGREIAVTVPDNLPLVTCDPVLVGLVVLNLLENALKYTPPGSPLELEALAAEGGVQVELRDRGRGIEPGSERRLFEKFTRGSGQTDGLGLGLAICKAIVTAHGGAIWAENRPGGGAVFAFTLPAAPGGAPPGPRTDAP